MSSSVHTLSSARVPDLPRPHPSARNCYRALLLAVLTLAAVLRGLHLGDKSFWMDEGVSFAISHLSWSNFLRISWGHELNMFPYHLLLRAWMSFGTSEGYLRALSAIFSIATVAVIYQLGCRLFGARAGLFAALLAAVHVFLIRYAQEARSYSLLALLASLSCLLFVRNIQGENRGSWTGYIITTVIAVYTHFFALLVVLAQWLSLRVLPQEQRQTDALRRVWKTIALSLLPMVVFIAFRGAGPVAWIPRTTNNALYQFLLVLTGNGGKPLLAAYAVLFLAGVSILIVQRLRWESFQRCWGLAFVLTWLLLPVLTTLIFSLARPVFLPRYLIICAPPLVLLAAAVLVRLPSLALQLPLLALLCWFSIAGVKSYYRADFDISREDWRDATAYVLSHAQSGDGVVFHAALARMPFEYYLLRDHSSSTVLTIAFPRSGPTLTYKDFTANAKRAPIAAIARDYPRVWLVLAHNRISGVPDDVTQNLEAALTRRFSCVDRRQFPEIEIQLYTTGDCSAAGK